MQRIIYPNDDGGVSIIVPVPNCGLSIVEIAQKEHYSTATQGEHSGGDNRHVWCQGAGKRQDCDAAPGQSVAESARQS